MSHRAQKRDGRGFALFLSLLLLLVLTISGVALMFNTSVENTLSGTETKIAKTFYAADSGIEYAGAALRGPALVAVGTANLWGKNYQGGALPKGLYSYYPGISTPADTGTPDIAVTVSVPKVLGVIKRPGDSFPPAGVGGGANIVEQVYFITSTATSTSLQAQKTIAAQVGLYPSTPGI